jgi:hypothetical protein
VRSLRILWATLCRGWRAMRRRFTVAPWRPPEQGEATERWQAEIDARLRAMEAEWRVKGRHS